MSSKTYICRECGRHFGGSDMAWEAIDFMNCPQCGGIEIEIDFSKRSSFEAWSTTENVKRRDAA